MLEHVKIDSKVWLQRLDRIRNILLRIEMEFFEKWTFDWHPNNWIFVENSLKVENKVLLPIDLLPGNVVIKRLEKLKAFWRVLAFETVSNPIKAGNEKRKKKGRSRLIIITLV